ncbi:MAG: hypothetical protein AAFQ74_10585 [Cyanobacteria bacterium J06623_4]
MNQTSEMYDDTLPEYDFAKLPVIARGPGRKQEGPAIVELAPDVAAMFPDSGAVNEGLRLLMRLLQKDYIPPQAF